MTLILGINAFHADASAALIRDGVIVAAVEEERFRRIKHWAGFPELAICWCLEEAGVRLRDVEHVAINSQPSAHRLRKLLYTVAKRPSLGFLAARWRNKRERASLADHLAAIFPDEDLISRVHFVEHHRAHLASAYYCSSFNKAAVISVDGFGDFASSAWGWGHGTSLDMDGQIFFPHSLGAFYTAITQYLGFPSYGDEYKVMGLAPYGKPKRLQQMREIVSLRSDGTFRLNLKFFRHASENLPHQWSQGTPVVGEHWSAALEDLLGPSRKPEEAMEGRHLDIASSAQTMYEEAFFHLLASVHKKHPVKELCIAGGCGANSVANGKVSRFTPFQHVYVQAAAGVAGGALGAALDVWHQLATVRCSPMRNAYLGYQCKDEEICSLLESPSTQTALNEANCSVKVLTNDQLCLQVAEAISRGLVVGWYQGRMEWGPRALGNRSILGDPRRANMKEILNQKIKRRESFRPFAPSILKDAVPDWFNQTDEVPFMMKVFPIREEKRHLIPAVTHVDGTGRLQTVSKNDNGRYYQLISAFEKITGIPIVLNTSFNENEPIVCTPSQALDCFLRTRMDVLVLEDRMIERQTDGVNENNLSEESSSNVSHSCTV